MTAYQVWNSFNGGNYGLAAEVPAVAGATQAHEIVDPTTGAWSYKIAARNSVGVGPVSEATIPPGVPSQVGQPTLEIIVT